MAPCLSPVLDERFEGSPFYAVCEVHDSSTHNLVAAAYGEGLRSLLALHLLSSSHLNNIEMVRDHHPEFKQYIVQLSNNKTS